MKGKMFHYKSCGLPNIYLRNGFMLKKTPYGPGVSIDNVEGLHKAIGLSIVQAGRSLSKDEIRFLRKELDMSQAQLGHFLDVGESTVRNWENGRTEIPGPADRLLRSLYKEYACGQPQVKALLEHLSRLNRDGRIRKLEFEETKGGWRSAA